MRERKLRAGCNARAVTLGVLGGLLGLGMASKAEASIITLASDPSWDAYDANPASGTAHLLGAAEYVADNASAPTNQPPGTVVYGYPAAGGMTANLSSIPGAHWIWAPGITGATLAP